MLSNVNIGYPENKWTHKQMYTSFVCNYLTVLKLFAS